MRTHKFLKRLPSEELAKRHGSGQAQRQMFKDVDALACRDRGLWDGEHRRLFDAQEARRKRVMGKIGRALVIVALGAWYGFCLGVQA